MRLHYCLSLLVHASSKPPEVQQDFNKVDMSEHGYFMVKKLKESAIFTVVYLSLPTLPLCNSYTLVLKTLKCDVMY